MTFQTSIKTLNRLPKDKQSENIWRKNTIRKKYLKIYRSFLEKNKMTYNKINQNLPTKPLILKV